MAKIAKGKFDNQIKWEDRIFRAKKVRDNWKALFNVDKGRLYFDGVQNPGYPENEWVMINKIYSHLKATLPTLYATDPYFYVKVSKSYSPNPLDIVAFEKRGKIRQSMLNYLKKELKLKEKIRLSILDAHFSYGVEKIYYRADLEENENYGNSITGEDGEFLIGEDGAELQEPEYIPVNERYCVTRIHPDDFLWDEDAGPLEDSWGWVAQAIDTTLEEIKKDKRYDKKAIRLLEGKGSPQDDEARAREERKKGDIKGKSESDAKKPGERISSDEPIRVWEIYDLKKDKITAIAEGGEIPLIDEEDIPPGVEKHCFAILRFTLRDDSPYPIPPVSPMLKLQDEKIF